MPRWLGAWWRIARATGLLLHGVVICAAAFPFLTSAQRADRVRRWSAQMLAALGVALQSSGTARTGGTLLVANHVSWLDILAINAVAPARFVSKGEIRRWPLIGWLVACAGTLFIERERKRDALRVVHQVADALRRGHTIAVFPEGTTSNGHGLLPFHANLLQAAIAAQVPVQPVVLRYADECETVSQAAAYVGDTHLLRSLWRIAMARGLRVSVAWLDPTSTPHGDRRALSACLHEQIGAALRRQRGCGGQAESPLP